MEMMTPATEQVDQSNVRGWFPRLIAISALFGQANKQLALSWRSLSESPPELWIAFVLKFLESYSYFAISQVLVLYLHSEFHLSDLQAGTCYGIWGFAATGWGLCTSWINDSFGVKNSLLFGFMVSFVAIIILASASSYQVVSVVLFGLLPLGNSIGLPMLTVGIKRYTTKSNRAFAFGMFYSVMNIAAFTSGILVDTLTIGLGDSPFRVLGVPVTANRMIIMSSAICSLISFTVTGLWMREIKVTDVVVVSTSCVETLPPHRRRREVQRDSSSEDYSLFDNDLIIMSRDAEPPSEPMNPESQELQYAFVSTENKDECEDFVDDRSNHSLLPVAEGKTRKERLQNILAAHNRSPSPRPPEYKPLINLGSTESGEKKRPNLFVNTRIGFTVEPVSSSPVCKESAKCPTSPDENVCNPLANLHPQYNEFSAVPLSSPMTMENDIERNLPEKNSPSQVNASQIVQEYVPKRQNPFTLVVELFSSPTFWRFTVLTLFLINLKSLFRHLDATLPTYLVRTFGSSVPKGTIYAINPFIIMLLTPVISSLTANYPHYDMIKMGGYISGISPLFCALFTSLWAVVMFVITLSFGEALWSPRVYDYTISVAPEGKEATFAQLAVAPIFLAKVPVGLLSGYLVATYLPETGHQNGRMLWLIVGLLALSSAVLITIFEPCIREPERVIAHNSESKRRLRTRRKMKRNSIQGSSEVELGERTRGMLGSPATPTRNSMLYEDVNVSLGFDEDVDGQTPNNRSRNRASGSYDEFDWASEVAPIHYFEAYDGDCEGIIPSSLSPSSSSVSPQSKTRKHKSRVTSPTQRQQAMLRSLISPAVSRSPSGNHNSFNLRAEAPGVNVGSSNV